MDSLNRLFTEKAASLRTDAMRELDAFLILYNDCLYIRLSEIRSGENIEQQFEYAATLYLEKYNVYKTLAHYIIYASLKHGRNYDRINDLCEKQRDHVVAAVGADITRFFDCSVKELMQMASNEYVSQLHSIVQSVKNKRYQGAWPEKMLVLVCGPASPRYGHPAMQYFARLVNKPLEQLAGCCMAQRETRGFVEENCCVARKETLEFVEERGEKDEITYVPKDATQYQGRRLFYVENAHAMHEAERIGLSLYVEETVFSRFVSMKTDILAPMVQATLKKECKK